MLARLVIIIIMQKEVVWQMLCLLDVRVQWLKTFYTLLLSKPDALLKPEIHSEKLWRFTDMCKAPFHISMWYTCYKNQNTTVDWVYEYMRLFPQADVTVCWAGSVSQGWYTETDTIPINVTACLWMVGGSRSTRRETGWIWSQKSEHFF